MNRILIPSFDSIRFDKKNIRPASKKSLFDPETETFNSNNSCIRFAFDLCYTLRGHYIGERKFVSQIYRSMCSRLVYIFRCRCYVETEAHGFLREAFILVIPKH